MVDGDSIPANPKARHSKQKPTRSHQLVQEKSEVAGSRDEFISEVQVSSSPETL